MEVDEATLEAEGAREAMEECKGIVMQITTLDSINVKKQVI